MRNLKNKPNTWFWVLSIIALLWNLIGLNAYLQQVFNIEAYKDVYTAEQIDMILRTPHWVNTAFAIAVFSGCIGCVLLLLRQKLSYIFLIISGVTVVLQMGYGLGTGNVINFIIPILTILVSMVLIWFCKMALAKKWIN